MIELAQLRWFEHIVRMGMRYPKMVWQARTQGKRPKGRLNRLGKKDAEDFEGKRD
jgi:hypothetical protein